MSSKLQTKSETVTGERNAARVTWKATLKAAYREIESMKDAHYSLSWQGKPESQAAHQMKYEALDRALGSIRAHFPTARL